MNQDNNTGSSEFVPDDTRKLQLEAFINCVCIGSTGRLGICTHITFAYDGWICAGFGLDGKGTWSSAYPVEIATADEFYDLLMNRFDGRLSSHDVAKVDADDIATQVINRLQTSQASPSAVTDALQRLGSSEAMSDSSSYPLDDNGRDPIGQSAVRNDLDANGEPYNG